MGKGRKISHVQTIVVGGDERNKYRPVYRVTIIHKIISNKLIQQVVNTLS